MIKYNVIQTLRGCANTENAVSVFDTFENEVDATAVCDNLNSISYEKVEFGDGLRPCDLGT